MVKNICKKGSKEVCMLIYLQTDLSFILIVLLFHINTISLFQNFIFPGKLLLILYKHHIVWNYIIGVIF